MTLVESWFGTAFTELHPLLQHLHREGGVLSGPVEIRFRKGVAGIVGRHLARRLGVPTSDRDHRLQVTVYSDGSVLHWKRKFDGESEFPSEFVPSGRYPHGHWIERSALLELTLRVKVIDGAWHWQQESVRLAGIPLPESFAPRTIAYKQALDGQYRFSVEIHLPLVGRVLTYSGVLSLAPRTS